MNKELEALERIKKVQEVADYMEKETDIIETALKNYEEGLYNAKTYVKHTSSQALYDLLGLAIKNVHKSFWKLPEQLFEDVNKSLKILEYLKEICLDGKDKYGKGTWGWVEFDLDKHPKLKKWLKDK